MKRGKFFIFSPETCKGLLIIAFFLLLPPNQQQGIFCVGFHRKINGVFVCSVLHTVYIWSSCHFCKLALLIPPPNLAFRYSNFWVIEFFHSIIGLGSLWEFFLSAIFCVSYIELRLMYTVRNLSIETEVILRARNSLLKNEGRDPGNWCFIASNICKKLRYQGYTTCCSEVNLYSS